MKLKTVVGIVLALSLPAQGFRQYSSDSIAPAKELVRGAPTDYIQDPNQVDNNLHAEQYPNTKEQGIAKSKSDCVPAGCSGQLCMEREDAESRGFSTCEWRPEYECLKYSQCTRQADGTCGWTQTPEYLQCRSEYDQPEEEPGMPVLIPILEDSDECVEDSDEPVEDFEQPGLNQDFENCNEISCLKDHVTKVENTLSSDIESIRNDIQVMQDGFRTHDDLADKRMTTLEERLKNLETMTQDQITDLKTRILWVEDSIYRMKEEINELKNPVNQKPVIPVN